MLVMGVVKYRLSYSLTTYKNVAVVSNVRFTYDFYKESYKVGRSFTIFKMNYS